MIAMKQMRTHAVRKLALTTLLAAGTAMIMAPTVTQAAKRFIAVGTGGPTGVYFVVGSAICKMMHKPSPSCPTMHNLEFI